MISFAENFMGYTTDQAIAFDEFQRHIRQHIANHDKALGRNPLARMCNYRDTHNAAIAPRTVSTAKPAPAGLLAVAGFGHRLGLPK